MTHHSYEQFGQEGLFPLPKAADAEVYRFPATPGWPTIAERAAALETPEDTTDDRTDAFEDLGGRPATADGERDASDENVPLGRRSPNITPLRRSRRSFAGPVRGEDVEPHVDQRLSPDKIGDFADGMRMVNQVLGALAADRVVQPVADDIHAKALAKARAERSQER